MVHNRQGMQVHGQFAVYRRNVLASNRIGAESGALLPLNRVRANDFVGNDRYVETQDWNVLHVWRGNYWAGAPGLNWNGDRYLERSFRPTGPVDGSMATAPGAPTLARSPAVVLIRQLQRLVPGLQSAGVLDPRPLARPVRPDVVERMRMRYDDAGRHEDPDPWDYVS
jgi:nitrous oxidase accessory protein NosD